MWLLGRQILVHEEVGSSTQSEFSNNTNIKQDHKSQNMVQAGDIFHQVNSVETEKYLDLFIRAP